MKHETDAIDVVICWVDGSDQNWLKEKHYWEKHTGSTGGKFEEEWNRGDIRYRDWGTLRFFFRGIEKYAPWIRNIYFITWGHYPQWLNIHHPKLQIVHHEDYIPSPFLPTFNSHTIELNLHRISGLSERFIYFNDDQFITAPADPEDFFLKGLPRDSAVLNPIPMSRKIGHAEINNIAVINDHFVKNEVMKKDPFKWFSARYGTKVFRNCLLMPWKSFVGLYEQHLPTSFLKSTFDTVWAVEEEELTRTCMCKFRENSNVNQWLFKNWQIAEGKFIPRSFRIGKMFMYGEQGNYEAVCEAIRERKWKLLCINDTEDIDDFETRRDQLANAFEQALGKRSSYELE